MNEKRTYRLERAVCPKCGATSSRVTLLTSFVVYLQCRDCRQPWTMAPRESAQSEDAREHAADRGPSSANARRLSEAG
jgi:hypothetical protein